MKHIVTIGFIILTFFIQLTGQDREIENHPGEIELIHGTITDLEIKAGDVSGIVAKSGEILFNSVQGDPRLSIFGSKLLEPEIPYIHFQYDINWNNTKYFISLDNTDNQITSSPSKWDIGINSTQFGDNIVFRFDNGIMAQLTSSGAWQNSSSKLLKENIQPISSALSSLLNINATKYNRKKSPGIIEYGFIAQEIEKIYPEIVNKIRDEDGTENYLVSYTQMIPILTKAIQEQHDIITNLQERILILEN